MTPALIGFVDEEGKVYTMCTDRDGYPSWTGWQLVSQYPSFALAKKLVLYGDIAALYPSHTKGGPQQSVIRAYANVMTALLNAVSEEIDFAYVFEEGQWMFYNLTTDIRYPGKPLSETIIADLIPYEE